MQVDSAEFEYLCKPCHRECCHQNRDGLEETLVTAGAGRTDRKTFLKRYCELAADDTEPISIVWASAYAHIYVQGIIS